MHVEISANDEQTKAITDLSRFPQAQEHLAFVASKGRSSMAAMLPALVGWHGETAQTKNQQSINMNELIEKILRWADDKGILANGTPKGQLSKTLEELIETAQAVALYELFSNEECLESACDDALDAVKDGVGDVYVTLVIHAKLAGYEFSSRERANCADAMTNKYILNEFSIWLPALVRNESPEMMSRTMIFLLHGLAMNHGLTLRECVEHSYNVIAKRTGEMIDGLFVKSK